MKFAFKSLVAVAAFVAVGAASATPYAGQWSVVGGTGSLTFSADALSALSASGSGVITPAKVSTGFPGAGATNTAVYDKVSKVGLTFASATISGDNLTSLTAANSLVTIRRSVVTQDDDGNNVITNNNVYLSNFRVDLSSATIFADLYSNVNTGALTSYGNKAIFQASGVTGGNITVTGVTGNVANGAASGSLNGPLLFNNATADIVLTSLGLATTGSVATLVKTADFGTTQASGTFTAPAVPEPSTYALLGAGLVAVGAMARRRKSA